MKRTPSLTFGKGDWLAVILVVIIAVSVAAAFVPGRAGADSVQIFQDGRLVKTLPLSVDETVIIAGDYSNTITVRDGKAAITASDCPGEDCVHSGWIGSSGRSIVCLPNRVEVRIVGESEVDFIVG